MNIQKGIMKLFLAAASVAAALEAEPH